jgi:uncharacterized protein (DUF2062 family)
MGFGSLKIETLIVSNLWTFIYLLNQYFLEHTRAISYSPEKDLSNGVLHTPIRNDFAPALKGFVVGSQILNLIFNVV